MSKITFTGPAHMRLSSFIALNRIAIGTFVRHALGRRIAPDWDAQTEIGILFMRHQFTRAMRMGDMARGRVLFDSLLTQTDDVYAVETSSVADPKGAWHIPAQQTRDVTILYLHGGGYSFHGHVSKRFAQMLAYRLGARVFAPDYRLTPEHPHPAQAQDAQAAWHYLRKSVPADKIVVIGDSAGGHMALMLLQSLHEAALDQPALCVGLCPWTDIGARGDSLHGNDRYDLVQGWMALQFGAWLDPDGTYGRTALSPISYDFTGLAPLYLQAGGRENLRDMIVDFAHAQAANGAEVTLDLWPDMPHDFQGYDSWKAASRQALARLNIALDAYTGDTGPLPAYPEVTQVASKLDRGG